MGKYWDCLWISHIFQSHNEVMMPFFMVLWRLMKLHLSHNLSFCLKMFLVTLTWHPLALLFNKWNVSSKRHWGRMNICIYMTESLLCSPETMTTLFTGCTPKQNIKFKREKKIKMNFKKILFYSNKTEASWTLIWKLSDPMFQLSTAVKQANPKVSGLKYLPFCSWLFGSGIWKRVGWEFCL